MPLAVGIGLLGGCSQPPPMSAENRDQFNFNVVETNAGYNLSAQQLFDFVTENKYVLTGGTLSREQLADILDSLLIDTLAGVEARSIQLKQYRLIYRDYLIQYEDYLIGLFTDSTVISKVTAFDSSEVLAYYARNPERFTIKEQVRLYQILVSGYGLETGPDSAYYKKWSHAQLREESRERINEVYRLLQYGEVFENVADAFNQDVRTRDSHGLVGWTTRGVYLDPFDSVAFNLKVGEFSKPYLDKDGWHILYIDGRLQAGPLPIDTPGVFEHVREVLLREKQLERSHQIMDSLRQGLHIEANDAILDTNIYLVDDDTWCGVVNGQDTIRAFAMKFYEEGARQANQVNNTTADMKRQMMKTIADRYLSLQAVRRMHWDSIPAAVEFEQSLRHSKSKQIVLNRQYDFEWVPTDSAIAAYYQKHLGDYVFEKPATLQYMTVEDSTFASFLHDQAITGMDLPEVLNQFSATSPGGTLSVSPVMQVGARDIPFEIWQAAVITPIGGVSSIVKSGGNFVFVKVLNHRESQNLALARGGILVTLQKEHQRELYEAFKSELYKKYDVRFPRRLGPVNLEAFWIRNKKPS